MATPVDLEENEEIVNRHVLLSGKLFELAMDDARKYTMGNLSMFFRMLLRKHYNLPGMKLE